MSLESVIAKFHLKLGVTLCSITALWWCTRMLTYINFCMEVHFLTLKKDSLISHCGVSL